MNWLREAMRQYLDRNGYDGLWCDGVPCGCLNDDLIACGGAPCSDSIHDCCEPGYRREYRADDECGCDCQGMDHWHVGPDKPQEKEGE